MKPLPKDLLAVLSEEYPDVRDARSVWVRAGGTSGEVENISRPRDLWQTLWLRSVRGASVRPAALLRAALDDLPNNPHIIAHLRSFADERALEIASNIVAQVEAGELAPDRDDTLQLLAEWEVEDEVDAFAAICPALEGRIGEGSRSEFRMTLCAVRDELQSGVLTGLVKAGTATAVHVFLAALAAT